VTPNTRKTVWKNLPTGGFVIIIIAASLSSWFEHTGFVQALKMANFDAFVVSQNPVHSEKVVRVEIDEEDYKDEKTFKRTSPLSQSQVMSLVESIAKARPIAIVVDLDTSDWDPTKITPAWIGAPPRLPSDTPAMIWARPLSRKEGQPAQLSAVAGKRDVDLIDGSLCWGVPEVLETRGVVRSYRPLVPFGSGTVPSLASAAAIVFRSGERRSGAPSGEPAAAPNCKVLSYLGKPATKEALLKTGALKFDIYTSSQVRKFKGFPFQGKLVVLGGTFPEARDQLSTPVGQRPGIEILATSIDSELGRPIPLHPPLWRFFTVDILFGFALLLVGHFLPKKLRVPFVLLLLAAAIVCSFLIFDLSWYFFSFMPVLIGIFLHRVLDEWWEGLGRRKKTDDVRSPVSEMESIELSLRIDRERT